MSENEKTYLIIFKNGVEKRITVPANWKVTFGPCVAGHNSDGNTKMPLALRFYEDKDTQRAIFTDVSSFRDMSIKVMEKKISTQEEVGYVERAGVKKATTFMAHTTEWVNPDDDSNPIMLPDVPKREKEVREDGEGY